MKFWYYGLQSTLQLEFKGHELEVYAPFQIWNKAASLHLHDMECVLLIWEMILMR